MRRVWQPLLISLIVGAVSLYLAAPRIVNGDMLRLLGRLKPQAFAVIALPVVGWWLLSAWRLTFLARPTGTRLTLWQGVQTHIVGVFSAVVTPAGGGNSLGIAFLLMRFGFAAKDAVAVTVMTVVGDMAFFAWAVPAAFFVLRAAQVPLPIAHLGALITGLSLLTLLASYLLAFRLPLATAWLRWGLERRPLRRFRAHTSRFLHELELTGERFAGRPWHWHLRFHALSALARGSYFLVLNLVLAALGLSISQAVVLAVQVIIHAFAFVMPTPGASGYQEAAMTVALKGRLGTTALTAGVVLWRFYQHYIYFLLGPLVGGAALARSRDPTSPPTPSGE